MLTAGLETSSQAEVGSAVLVFHNLHVLKPRIEQILQFLHEKTTKSIRSALTVHDLTVTKDSHNYFRTFNCICREIWPRNVQRCGGKSIDCRTLYVLCVLKCGFWLACFQSCPCWKRLVEVSIFL